MADFEGNGPTNSHRWETRKNPARDKSRGAKYLISCPSWARTRTLLIQSQTCCQLHQGALVPHYKRETGFEPATLSLGS